MLASQSEHQIAWAPILEVSMFRGDLDAQRRMFTDVMRSIVYGLSRFAKIEGELARRSSRRGSRCRSASAR